MLPNVCSDVMITPTVWKRPLLRARAAPFGRYPRVCMACTTRARVCSSTFEWPLDTRDTVCDDTPASRATSAIEGRGAPAAVIFVRVMSSRVSPVADVRPKSYACASMLGQCMFA